jgi:DNA replication protein DnaC
MESLGEALMAIIKEQKPNLLDTMSDFDNAKYLQRKADEENEQEGNLKGIDCRKCKNKGHISIVKDGELMWQMCECNKARKSLLLIEQSGLKPLLDEYTFEKYEATEPWQKNALSMAQNFVEYGEGNWLFFGGMSGSGKSHLCTAICGELLKRGKAVKYMMWKDEATKLKSLVTDSYEYGKLIDELKSVDVLYIDDFLKVQRGKQPTEADVNLAFEILNYRYANKSLTLISTEKTIDEIISLDDALGGRIYQMSKNYSMNIAYDRNKNFRLRR